MAHETSIERVANLLEKQIALDLYFRGASQDTIARLLGKRKKWVNDLLRGVPKGNNR